MGDVTVDAKGEVAAMLRAAEHDRVPCAPVRDLLPGATVADAYEVQRVNTELAVGLGRRVCGWKVGLTAKVVQQQFGVHQPDFGALFADRSCGDDEEIALDELIQPRAEAEVAFVLDSDLSDRQITAIDVLRATAFVVPAFTVAGVDSSDDDFPPPARYGLRLGRHPYRDRCRQPCRHGDRGRTRVRC